MRKDAHPGRYRLSAIAPLVLAAGLLLIVSGCLFQRSPQALRGDGAPYSERGDGAPFSGVAEDTPDNVILVTWDGVRPRELLTGADPELIQRGGLESSPWAKASPDDLIPFIQSTRQSGRARFWGSPRTGALFPVSAPSFISLPSYQAMLTGRVQDCESNYCGLPKDETVLDRLHREMNLPFTSLGLIASWTGLKKAASQRPVNERPFLVSAGQDKFPIQARDAVHADIDRRQEADEPLWEDSRKDSYTMEHALHFIHENEPRFLMVALGDTDEWGHRTADHPEDYAHYLESIHQNDQWLKELSEMLARMGDYGRNTTVIVTTDHGRGEGKDFDHHDRRTPGSGQAWAWISGHRVLPESDRRGIATVAERRLAPLGSATHVDLRPTIETWLGLVPMSCPHCGHLMSY